MVTPLVGYHHGVGVKAEWFVRDKGAVLPKIVLQAFVVGV
ncbi:unnamed protein product [marine sediment metagenome]|uniref:Uncharacterized protein n=1 Tax=marine sediment metagenome TaxID=412755 RepID=X1KBV1_9ZZZZ